MKFSEVFRAVLDSSPMSLRGLARELGLSPASVHQGLTQSVSIAKAARLLEPLHYKVVVMPDTLLSNRAVREHAYVVDGGDDSDR